MAQIRDEFDRMFERFFRLWPAAGLTRGGEQQNLWGLDVQDEDDAVTVRAEVPGFEVGDIDLNVRDNRLVIRASRKSETGGKEGRGQAWEQRAYFQAVTLPAAVDEEKIDARYKNGVLTVRLPKTQKGRGRKIHVRGE
jgi:HSP20 family protein